MYNKETISKQIRNLESEIHHLESIIVSSPEGKLIARKLPSGNYRYSLKSTGADSGMCEKYIDASAIDIAKKLALKEYSKYRIRDAKQEIYFLKLAFSFLNNKSCSERYLDNHPGVARLVKPLLCRVSDELEKWKNAEYIQNVRHPEGLIFPTSIPGLMVRSKAEADIINQLEHFGVPYHYEEELRAGNIVIHPDFTCRNIKTGKIIYWEHQGMWDNSGYVKRLSERNDVYCKLGISPGDNLIVTAETSNSPLDIVWVNHLIQYYLV